MIILQTKHQLAEGCSFCFISFPHLHLGVKTYDDADNFSVDNCFCRGGAFRLAVYSSGPFGLVYGHAGWIPGYVSSLRHYPEHGVTIAFQINTDIGIIDSDDDVLRIIEERLMQVFIGRKK